MMGPALMLFASGGEGGSAGEEVIYTAPSNLSVYDYQGGAKYGLQWTNGNSAIPTEVYRDNVLFETRAAGLNMLDIGLKAGDGVHTWQVRHKLGNGVSNFSPPLSTLDGGPV